MNISVRYITTTLVFLILLIPLVFDKSGFYGYVVPKALLFQILVLFGSVIHLLSIKKINTISFNYLSLSVIFFGVITLLINLFSYDNLLSIGATFERMEGAVNTLLLCILFFLAISLLNNNKKQKYSFLFMLTVSLIVALFGIWSNNKIVDRIISTIGNPAFLCFYLANHLFLAAILYIKYNYKHPWILLFIIILLFFAIFQTLTRTFYISIIFSGIIMLILYIIGYIKKEKRAKVLAISTFLTIIIAFLLYYIIQNPWVKRHIPIDRLTNINTLDSRFSVWQVAFNGFADRWLFGWGQENFNYVYAKFFKPELAEGGVWYDRSHNVFLDWFVSGGIVGGLSFIAVWVSAFYYVWQSNFQHLIKILLTGWVVFYCCFICFNPDSLVNTVFAIIMLAFIYLNSPVKTINISIFSKYFSIINLFAIGFLGTIFYQFTYQNIRSYMVFSKAISEPTIENLIELSNKAYTIRSAVNLNMVEQLTFMHGTVLGSQLLPEQKYLYTQSVQKLIKKELNRHPPSVKILELESMIELNINDLSAGERTLDRIIELSPNYALAYMQKSRIAISQNKLEKAMVNLNKITEIAPNYIPAKLFKIYVTGLKTPNYDIKGDLKKISQIDLATHIKLVREIFSGLGKKREFVYWIWDKNLIDIFMPKQVYFEWITTAFQIGDLEGLRKILIIYNDNYKCDSYLLEKIVSDAQKGIPPNQSLQELFIACPNAK